MGQDPRLRPDQATSNPRRCTTCEDCTERKAKSINVQIRQQTAHRKRFIIGFIGATIASLWLSNAPINAANDHLSTPKHFARVLYTRQGGTAVQYGCLVKLWTMESHWNMYARNTHGGALGIPQALPATKMAQFGRDYKSDYQTQIRWGLLYIRLHWHNSACNALKHERKYQWY